MSTTFSASMDELLGTPVPRQITRRMHNPYAVTPSMSPAPSITADELTPSNLSFALMPASIITVTPVTSPVVPSHVPSSLYHAMSPPVPLAVPLDGSLAGPVSVPNTPPPSSLQVSSAFAEVTARAGELRSLARCGTGSSFLQTAIREDARCATLVWQELLPEMGELLLDAHGGYVVKSLLERVPREDAKAFTDSVALDENLALLLCTQSLHTRRLVQVIMESVDPNFLCGILTARCAEVARTQQGCIVLQRAMDFSTGKAREALFAAVRANIAAFAVDPFANYVVQYYLDSLPREETGPAVWASIQGRVLELSCNKFASNVLEKFLLVADGSAQHELIQELYSSGDHALYTLMQDGFGNYIIQASIARATFADVVFINEKLRPVLDHVPYGSKIIMRLDRRLRDRSAGGAAAAASAPFTPSSQPSTGAAPTVQTRHHNHHHHQGGHHHGGHRSGHSHHGGHGQFAGQQQQQFGQARHGGHAHGHHGHHHGGYQQPQQQHGGMRPHSGGLQQQRPNFGPTPVVAGTAMRIPEGERNW